MCSTPGRELPIPFPLVLKVLGSELAHKTELGGVALNLADKHQVLGAARAMAGLSERFLLEEMIGGAVAELIVGVTRDPQFGLCLTIGAGGIFVELLRQSVQLLLPASRADIERALERLALYPVLQGYRGRPAADLAALVDAIEAIAGFAMDNAERLSELDVNPLLALADGAVAVDALIRIKEPA
jgi:acetyl-CoA synthetase